MDDEADLDQGTYCPSAIETFSSILPSPAIGFSTIHGVSGMSQRKYGTPMILYHFTSAHTLRGIAKHGLMIGDVPLDLRRNKSRLDIWLTSSRDRTGHGLSGTPTHRTAFRFIVELQPHPSLVRWSEWAPGNVNPETIANLKACSTLDGPSQWETWFISFPVVPSSKIVARQDARTEEWIASWSKVSPIEFDVPAISPWRRDA